MKTEKKFKVIEELYQSAAIHFMLDPENEHIMVNAKDMAKVFNKQTSDFLRTDMAVNFIDAYIKTENEELHLKNQDVKNVNKRGYPRLLTFQDVVLVRQKAGTLMHKNIAIFFAMWLDPYFAVWVIKTIDKILTSRTKFLIEQVTLKNSKKNQLEAEVKKAQEQGEGLAYTIIKLQKEVKHLEKLERRATASLKQGQYGIEF